MNIVSKHFRPEFINRIDETVVFHPLDKTNIKQIAEIQLNNLRKRLAQKDIELEVNDQVLNKLSEAGYDPVYGARPLKRAIQTYLENPLAENILSGKFGPKDVIKAVVNSLNEIDFQK
jgi:ATP-dependent Clp protease ATP-binding subunit ClpB